MTITPDQLEFRAAQVAGVSFPQRMIELIVMPYESETMVEIRGRLIREVIARGAFDGIERRANRVRVNRDHDVTKAVGRAVAFHPERPEGLVADLRIARTPLGDETLQLADEEILDASAGFAPLPGGEKWDTPDTRRITRAYLGHIAMTPDPAYPDARVLAVRHAEASVAPAVALETPNLDLVRAWGLQAAYDALDAGR
jgi:HK97 family phage prohead protease